MASELEEKILAIRNKSIAEAKPVETPVTETPEAVPTEEIQAEVTPEPAQPNDGEPVKEEEKAPEPELTSWDDVTEEAKPTAEINISEWVSDLELGEIKSKEDLKTRVTELKSKLKEYEEKPLTGIPEEFSEVIKVAKTGDWKEYLASQLIDYTKLDPIQEFENEFFRRAQNNPKYFTDGKFDAAKVEEVLESIPEVSRELEGSRLLEDKAELQARKRAELQAKAEAKRAEAEQTLAKATKNLSEILPLETFGIKFEPRHSSEIYQGIVSSKLTKKHFGVSYEDLVRTGADMKAVTRTITLAEKGEKMIAFKAEKRGTEVKKEILQKTQNVQLDQSGTVPQPEDPEKKTKSPVEIMKEYVASTRKGL